MDTKPCPFFFLWVNFPGRVHSTPAFSDLYLQMKGHLLQTCLRRCGRTLKETCLHPHPHLTLKKKLETSHPSHQCWSIVKTCPRKTGTSQLETANWTGVATSWQPHCFIQLSHCWGSRGHGEHCSRHCQLWPCSRDFGTEIGKQSQALLLLKWR